MAVEQGQRRGVFNRAAPTLARLRSSFAACILLTLLTITAEYLLVPALYNQSALLALCVLLFLILRAPVNPDDVPGPDSRPAAWRVLLFLVVNAGILVAAGHFGPRLTSAALTYSIGASALAATKLLILLTPVVLFPWKAWREIARHYNAELIATAMVLFTFLPFRAFATAWPWYSQALGKLIFTIGGLFVPHLSYAAAPFPTLAGPRLDVTIVFGCSGIEGVKLFDYLFGFVALLDWNRFNKMRLLVGYIAGTAAIILTNGLRILLFVIVGNRISADWVSQYHINAGWLFFVTVFVLFLLLTYKWMLQASAQRNALIQSPQVVPNQHGRVLPV